MHVGLVVAGGVDESGRERVTPTLLDLIERLTRRHAVSVYVLQFLKEPRTYSLLGAAVHDLGTPAGPIRQHAALHRATAGLNRPDILHAYMALPAGLAAAGVAARLHVPALVTLDSGEFVGIADISYGLQLRMRQRLALRATCALAARVTVCSEYQQDLARTHGCEAALVPIGVDTAQFVPAAGPTEPRLVHVASLNRVKNQQLLLDTLQLLARTHPRVHLDIAGEDTLGGDLQRRAHEMALDAHVTFHGYVANEDLPFFYQRASAAVITSRHEAACVAVLEAAACGVPTVGTRVGYVADWAPAAAVAVPAATPASLAAAIARVLDEPQLRSQLGDSARQRAIGRNADWTAAEFERHYRELCGNA